MTYWLNGLKLATVSCPVVEELDEVKVEFREQPVVRRTVGARVSSVARARCFGSGFFQTFSSSITQPFTTKFRDKSQGQAQVQVGLHATHVTE